MLDGLPQSIRIGAHDVPILHVEDLIVDGKSCWGVWDGDEMTITFNKKQLSDVWAFEIFLHEVSHAIYDRWFLSEQDSEERLVGAIATGWTQVLRENPQLIEWMQAALNGSSSSATTTSKDT